MLVELHGRLLVLEVGLPSGGFLGEILGGMHVRELMGLVENKLTLSRNIPCSLSPQIAHLGVLYL